MNGLQDLKVILTKMDLDNNLNLSSGSLTESIASMADSDYAIGCSDSPFKCDSDLALNTNFFSTFKNHSIYVVELRAVNGLGARGKNIKNLKFT